MEVPMMMSHYSWAQPKMIKEYVDSSRRMKRKAAQHLHGGHDPFLGAAGPSDREFKISAPGEAPKVGTWFMSSMYKNFLKKTNFVYIKKSTVHLHFKKLTSVYIFEKLTNYLFKFVKKVDLVHIFKKNCWKIGSCLFTFRKKVD